MAINGLPLSILLSFVVAEQKKSEKDRSDSAEAPQPGPSGVGAKRNADGGDKEKVVGGPSLAKRRPKDVWVGVELSDSDLESSDDESSTKEESG